MRFFISDCLCVVVVGFLHCRSRIRTKFHAGCIPKDKVRVITLTIQPIIAFAGKSLKTPKNALNALCALSNHLPLSLPWHIRSPRASARSFDRTIVNTRIHLYDHANSNEIQSLTHTHVRLIILPDSIVFPVIIYSPPNYP